MDKTNCDDSGRADAPSSGKVSFLQVGPDSAGQRLDNFLMKVAKGVPKSHIWRVIRSGEVRLNRKKASPSDKLEEGDAVRVPPMRCSHVKTQARPHPLSTDKLDILFEDRDLVVINKPAHLAVHGGSGISFGLIERLRASRPSAPFLELVHRLDRETSGALIVAKTRKALVRMHESMRDGKIVKHYRTLLLGRLSNDREHVKKPLLKYTAPDGQRMVTVSPEGQSAHSIFTCLERFDECSYADVELLTGRTHQIRVHACSIGHSVVGDEKYGDFEKNSAIAKGCWGYPFKRMFLHALQIEFTHPVSGEKLVIRAPLPEDCEKLLECLRRTHEAL